MKISAYSSGGLRIVECKTLGPTIISSEERVTLANCLLSGDIKIGFATYMNGGMIRSRVEIGRYCSIGRNVSIGLGNHDLSCFSTSSFFSFDKAENTTSPTFPDSLDGKRVIIENDVWIGDGVYILSGVRVGSGACIGAGSIITKDVEPYSVCVGSPAKRIRFRFDEDIRRSLLDLQWWHKCPDLLKDIKNGSPELLMSNHCIANSANIPPRHTSHRF